MASARLLKGVCFACRLPLTRLQNPNSCGLLFPQRRHASGKSALPPAAEIPEDDLADYEVSTEEFKFVERILPHKTVPPFPQHESYPTPSAWYPPKENDGSLPYHVRRTKNHMLPIYEEFRNAKTRQLVMIKHIHGDIWAFDADLRAYLKQVTGKEVIASQVHEVGGYIRVKGRFADLVCQFLLDKGF